MYAGPWFTERRRSKDGLTAAEVNGVPSWNVTFLRSSKVKVLLSFDAVHAVASPGARVGVAVPPS